jgi:hypothetical protein
MLAPDTGLPIRIERRHADRSYRATFTAPRRAPDGDGEAPAGFGSTRYDAIVDLLFQVEAPAPRAT